MIYCYYSGLWSDLYYHTTELMSSHDITAIVRLSDVCDQAS